MMNAMLPGRANNKKFRLFYQVVTSNKKYRECGDFQNPDKHFLLNNFHKHLN